MTELNNILIKKGFKGASTITASTIFRLISLKNAADRSGSKNVVLPRNIKSSIKTI